MKPRKSWEPDYRFGGHRGFYEPPPLGTKNGYGPIKPKKPKRKK